MNGQWEKIVDLAYGAVPEDIDSAEQAFVMVVRNAVFFTAIECAKVCEEVQLKDGKFVLLGKTKQIKFVKAIKEHFGLESVQ